MYGHTIRNVYARQFGAIGLVMDAFRRAGGHPEQQIAETFNVSRATLYRNLAES